MEKFLKTHPYWFVIVIFILTLVIPLPFVFIYNILNFDMEQLRLLIPIIESIFIIVIIWKLNWFTKTGFGTKIKNIHLLWLPTVLVFVPLSFFGSVQIASKSMFFYILAIFFTGVSEEGFARGVGLNVLLPKGKWVAVLFLAFLFGIGHITNFFFSEFSALEASVRLFTLVSFAIFYGAIYLRVQNIWPFIILHTLWDMSIVISGSAGPFMVKPMPLSFEVIIGIISIIYAWLVLKNFDEQIFQKKVNKISM